MTLALLTYPTLDPVAFRLGPVSVHWYGLAYIAAFIVAALILGHLNKRWGLGLTRDDEMDIMLAAITGVIVGGRVGYVLFYDLSYYVDNPLRVFATWDGGMSFHGGLIGLLLMGVVVPRWKRIPYLVIVDVGAVAAPLGIFFGRMGNFVNGELWGRITDAPWAMVFPGAGPEPRHPSQLYEASLEGLLLFAVLWALSRRRRPTGLLIGVFLSLYGLARTTLEQFREPDAQLGFVVGSFTMGQLLTVPMVLGGAWLVWRALRSRKG